METTFTKGQTVAVDGWGWPVVLEELESLCTCGAPAGLAKCAHFVGCLAGSHPEAEFRVTLPHTGVSLPVHVTVTGRKVRWEAPIKGGGVRVKVEFVEGEGSSTSVGGWMSWEELSVGEFSLNPHGV